MRFETNPPMSITQKTGAVRSQEKLNTSNLLCSRAIEKKPDQPPSVPAIKIATVTAILAIRIMPW